MTELSERSDSSRPTSLSLRTVRARILRDLIEQSDVPVTVALAYGIVPWSRAVVRTALSDLVALGCLTVGEDTARTLRLTGTKP